MTKQWWKEAVVYQIYPRSFNDSNQDGIGDIKGITEKLDYLAKLGIEVIWLSPVYESPNDDNGYDISNYRAIISEFGTMKDFDEMLQEAHKRNIKIMMDLVVNHTSDEHSWFIESRSSKDNAYRDYYIWKQPNEDGSPPTNWGAAFGGSAWQYDDNTGEYYLHLFSKKQPDLNWENPKVRDDVYNMMTFWLDKGVDGFRMDVINMISKDQRFPNGEIQDTGYGDGSPYYLNGPRIHEFLQEMNQQVLSKYDTITVGEMPGVNAEQAKLYTGENRKELNMVFHFEHVDIGNGKYGKWTPEHWNLTELKTIFSRWQEGLEEDGWNSLYWSNHDQPRAISRFADDSEAYRVLSGKMLATCLHMLKGTPYIYQGEEIGMTNVAFESIDDYRDIETLNAFRDYTEKNLLTEEEIMQAIHKRGRDNARTPVQWSSRANAGFTEGEPWIPVNPNYKAINVEEALADPDSIFYYYQKLIALRKRYPVIVHGKYELLAKDDQQIYAYTRKWKEDTLLVICNFSSDLVSFNLPNHLEFVDKTLLIANYNVDETEEIDSVELKPYEARVYNLR
ncbi:alpha-glucosidase [Paraliobacillus quinghaiensis]|uniref:oligo-1,6-glucosidase n=1 Tax=Paraliobacillus quinghaiensis TaxID=470815 RepID=A0A917WPX7_9BACI|nr:alpha-glucosidase [Paraliobacillus quinghaiensis]GGM19559.1 alpha-glucosidase [Paraliobacillus quinghaiensis]